MANYRAVVRFTDIPGPDVLTARRSLEERLQSSAIGNWRVVDIVPEGIPASRRARARWRADRDIAAKLMLVGAVVWAMWFFWVLVD
jgi:hypothetical protein